MKTLMLSTALVTASAFGAMAQESTGTMSADGSATVPAFLSSNLTGMSLYTLESEDARALRDDTDMTAAESDRLRWTSSETFIAERDAWNDVGAINDMVLTQDGELQGVLVDVGGFLGLGARTVMVDLADIFFVSNDAAAMTDDGMGDDATAADPTNGDAAEEQPEDLGDFSVVIAMSEDELEALPEWDEEQLSAGFEQRDYGMSGAADNGTETETDGDMAAMDGETAETEGDMEATEGDMAVFSDEYEMLDDEDRTADRLIGADVYDANGENIGAVDDVVLGGGDAVDGVIVDVGGFLGIGSHTVNLPIEDAQIGWNADGDDVRVQVAMSGDELEAMPEYEG